jgi:hypothetical protein
LRLLILSAFALLACAGELDRASEINNLRVLAVQKSLPYANPGQEVELRMLWHDGHRGEARPIQRTWVSGCFNPPGDQFFACFSELARSLGAIALTPGAEFDARQFLNLDEGERLCSDESQPATCIGSGDSFTFQLPPELIEAHVPPVDPLMPPYGLAYVFFAACAGELALAPPSDQLAFPLWCVDERGEPLGADHFVAGYSAIYAFDELRNRNPLIEGFVFDQGPVDAACIGVECLNVAPALAECSAASIADVPVCTRSDPEDCPHYSLYPDVPPDSIEIDEVTSGRASQQLYEHMWIKYYVDRGSVSSEVRLLSDATTGPVPAPTYATKFRAPGSTGPVNVWAVVHDSRGGVNWARIEVCVR